MGKGDTLAENSVESAQKNRSPKMGQRRVRGAYDIRFPTLARSSSGSKGLNSQARYRATPNGSYILNVFTI